MIDNKYRFINYDGLSKFRYNELTNNNLIYNNQTNNEKEDIIQCLICWEQATNQNKIHKMKHISLFISNCLCDCNFHLYYRRDIIIIIS